MNFRLKRGGVMATKSQKAAMTKGICVFCESEIDKNKMTQHLKFCKKRAAAIAAEMDDETKPKLKLFHLLVEGRYNPQYWMHIEMPASVPLYALDDFLRVTWVECCDHLSAFRIGGVSYESEPLDFENFAIQIPGAPEQEGQEIKVVEAGENDGYDEFDEDDEEEDMEEDEDEEEDLSPEEFAEELSAYLDELPPAFRAALPEDLQAELRKPRTRDELVAFLKEKLAALPELQQLWMQENIEQTRMLYLQRSFLEDLLEDVEDRSMNVPLEKVLKVGQKFTYEYDFGSTTELNLRVIAEREGIVRKKKKPVTILARNVAPVILCCVCGKPATQVESGYFNVEENAYCDKCAEDSEEAEMMLPIVNSPRVGVCGYTGD